MGIVRMPAERGPRIPRPSIPRLRVPDLILTPSRFLLVAMLAIGAAMGTEPWFRAVIASGALIVVYIVGHGDGWRDYALDLLRTRRDNLGAQPPPSDGPGA